jgi:putative transposase
MKRTRHSPEQIIGKLRQAEAELGVGHPIDQVCRNLEISQATFHRWGKLYGGSKRSEMRRLKELLADQVLDNAILKEALSGKC